MTYDYGAVPSAEDVVVSWLSPIGTASVERPAGDVLPFFMVTRVGGDDDKVWDYAMVQVDVFAADRNAAEIAARMVHRRMISVQAEDVINLTDGGTAAIDRVQTDHGPQFVQWDVNTMQRYVMQYVIDLRFDREGGS